MGELADILRDAANAWTVEQNKPNSFTIRPKPERLAVPTALIKGIPERFETAERSPEWLGRIASQNALSDLDALKANKKGNVVLWGPSGSGKSTMAAIGLGEQERSARWVRHREIELLSKWSPLRDGFPTVLEKYFDCPLLCVDNLDVTVRGDMLETLLEERYDRMRQTWFTTCHTLQEVAERWPHTGSRRIYQNSAVIKLG